MRIRFSCLHTIPSSIRFDTVRDDELPVNLRAQEANERHRLLAVHPPRHRQGLLRVALRLHGADRLLEPVPPGCVARNSGVRFHRARSPTQVLWNARTARITLP